VGLIHDTGPTPPSKSGVVGSTISLALWDSSLQELQECVSVGRSGSNVAGISGGGGSGNGFGGVVLGGFWNKVDGKGGKA